MPAQVVKPTPLFAGLYGATGVMLQHVSCSRQVTVEFDLLVNTTECLMQALAHQAKLFYRTQVPP
jgi:hypothetical protein